MEVPSIKHILSNCLIFIVINTIVIAQTPQRLTAQNPCTSKKNCHECIQTPSCAWCYDPEYKGDSRCFQASDGVTSNKLCHEEFVLNPNNILSILQNASLTKAHISQGGGGGSLESGVEGSFQYNESFSGSSSGSASAGGSWGAAGGASAGGRRIQITPQRLNLKLRARQSYSIRMYFTQTDSPIDLYYLMDLSKSMEDDKIKLYSLGDQLAFTMKQLTSDFRLGFGSFVDKVVMPYVNTLPEKLLRPCDQCVAPYGYQHHLTLSDNTNMFSDMVKQANVSGNLDAPEGGFDAIMQAVVCQDQIGWRKNVRRLLVFSTDASFHFAGDGKLGGIVKPNDGCCHLSKDGIYTESSFQDYPSIEQINLSVKKNRINVIFAVTKSIISIYEQLAKNVEGATVGRLEGDSSNIVELVKEQYEQISKRVEMKHNASSAVSLKFYTRCSNSEGALVNTNICDTVKVGDIIEFKIDIEVLKCPKNRADHFQTIQIYPVGINESLIIDLEMLCECGCERPGSKFYEENSPKCNHHGTYKCGVCECTKGAFGRNCECTSEETSRNVNETACVNPKTPNGLECSGKGQCVCRRCECEIRSNDKELIYGKYCECDNFSCERHDGKLCSDHGTCDCGSCKCAPGWEGTNCACSTNTTNCYPHGTQANLTCSGHGECKCGQCVCDVVDEGRYTGKFCEKCPTCPDRCEELKACVQCQQYQKGPLKENCTSSCKLFTPKEVEEVHADEDKGEIKCWYEDEDQCQYAFVYYYDENNELQVKAQRDLKCPDYVELPALILGVIAAVVLIGMAMLLLWKVFTTIHDKREFARFEKERMMAKWDTSCSDRCLEFKDCVQCRAYETGPYKEPKDCESNCTYLVPTYSPEVVADEDNNEVLCTYYDDEECRFAYVYYFDAENKIQLRAQEERECPSKVYVPGIVIGVVAAVVLIGMAILLLWKLLTTIHDRREFARFEKEKMMAKWDTGENPIYKQATSTFKNPTYAGKC